MTNNFDDILNGNAVDVDPGMDSGTFDKEAWSEKKKAIREEVYNISDKAAESLNDPSKFQQYLDVQAKFPRYTVGNALLIMSQKPDASRIGEFDYWKENHVRIRKNEKGFYILKPGNEYKRDDGSIGVGYDAVKVFDISQTTAKQRDEKLVLSNELTLIKALVNKCPAKIEAVENIDNNMLAAYDPQRIIISVQKGLQVDDLFRALSNEVAHAYMADGNIAYDRFSNEIYAYSTSYILCKQNGINTDKYDFSEAKDYFDKDSPAEIREELSKIRDIVNSISESMYKVFEAEQNKDENDRGESR